jgi:hypothetical protein
MRKPEAQKELRMSLPCRSECRCGVGREKIGWIGWILGQKSSS